MPPLDDVRPFQTDAGWVVSEGGIWVPGLYDSEETARAAVLLPDDALEQLRPVWHRENRPVTMADLDTVKP